MEAQEVKAQLEVALMDKEYVSGIGIGEDENGNTTVVVNVEEGKADAVSIPLSLQTENIEIRETGPFHAEILRIADPDAIDRKARHRPVPMSVSTGHVNITAGTVGFLVTDGNKQYVSSNNHVYANVNQGSQGDSIVQPGPTDGGAAPDDESAILAGYVPVENGAVLDFAWAEPTVEHELNIPDVGVPQGEPMSPSIGDNLIKAGRTTGVTEGTVEQVDVSVDVNYGDAGTITISGCILTGDMSDGGDSGSAVLEKSSLRPYGILFAGSSSATVHNPAMFINQETGLTIVTADDDGTERPSVTVNLTLTKQSPTQGDMTANVQDDQGNPLSGATITISGGTSATGTTDTNGVTTFTKIPIADYTVEATKSDYDSDSATVSAGDFS